MKKTKEYLHTKFSADVLREAIDIFDVINDAKNHKEKSPWLYLSIELDESSWMHDSEEEFFADYRQNPIRAHYSRIFSEPKSELDISVRKNSAEVSISFQERSSIHSVFDVFEKHHEHSKLPPPPAPEPELIPRPKIFIGHGGNPQWRDLKDHLHEKHNLDIEAYGIGARAGHAIRNILEDMLAKSSFAILVMTGEDEVVDGQFRARQNVIHEAGLFQGRLGFSKAIVLLEDSAEEFSNINGIEQIRFKKDNIKETFGDVLATIKREFPKSYV